MLRILIKAPSIFKKVFLPFIDSSLGSFVKRYQISSASHKLLILFYAILSSFFNQPAYADRVTIVEINTPITKAKELRLRKVWLKKCGNDHLKKKLKKLNRLTSNGKTDD